MDKSGSDRSSDYRIEKDSMGEVKVRADRRWGAQTQRSLLNFPIGDDPVPVAIIHSLAMIKLAAARVNHLAGFLDESISERIVIAARDVISGIYDDQFPLSVWQTGSGTHTNMNVNEVIAHLANEGIEDTADAAVHPNDHVNMSQSSNDTFPSALNIAAVLFIKNEMLISIDSLVADLQDWIDRFGEIIKTGRTHLQDASPMTLGQEFSAYISMLQNAKKELEYAAENLCGIPLGGTAVGNGLNTWNGYAKAVADELSDISGVGFYPMDNAFRGLSMADDHVRLHSAFRNLAMGLLKMGNDIRWMASGPRSGIGELALPENEPGSSIMPGKVNPSQIEALSMVSLQVFGNDTAVAMAAGQGNFELNVYRPLIARNIFHSMQILKDAIDSFRVRCLAGMIPITGKIKQNLDNSLMLVTALSPVIGYENSAKIAKMAHEKQLSLREAALASGLIDEETFDNHVRPDKMIGPYDWEES